MTYNEDNFKTRFNDAPWLKPQTITLGGAGGIGSWTALSLSRIGHKLVIYDNDKYEDFNIAGQFCDTTVLGRNKAEALSSLVHNFTNMKPEAISEKFIETSVVTPITIAAFDNMVARKLMFEKWAAQENRELFLDGRMSAEHFEVYAVTKGREEEYIKTLFPDHEANIAPCSYKATTHNAMGIAYVLTGCLNNFLCADPSGLRALPFKTEMNIAIFMFE